MKVTKLRFPAMYGGQNFLDALEVTLSERVHYISKHILKFINCHKFQVMFLIIGTGDWLMLQQARPEAKPARQFGLMLCKFKSLLFISLELLILGILSVDMQPYSMLSSFRKVPVFGQIVSKAYFLREK